MTGKGDSKGHSAESEGQQGRKWRSYSICPVDLEDVTRAENLTGFVAVTKAEAAYAHAWVSPEGYVNRFGCGLWMATPGRHEVSLHVCVTDLQLMLISFYRPLTLRFIRANLQVYGGTEHYERIMAACKSMRSKVMALEAGFPKQARRLVTRQDLHRKSRLKQLTVVQTRDFKEALRDLSSGNQQELEQGRGEHENFMECVLGDGLPPASTTLRMNGMVHTRLDAAGEEWPSEEFITQYCVPPGTRD